MGPAKFPLSLPPHLPVSHHILNSVTILGAFGINYLNGGLRVPHPDLINNQWPVLCYRTIKI